jgi:hypothetical protein
MFARTPGLFFYAACMNLDERLCATYLIARLDRAIQYSLMPVLEARGRGVLDARLRGHDDRVCLAATPNAFAHGYYFPLRGRQL